MRYFLIRNKKTGEYLKNCKRIWRMSHTEDLDMIIADRYSRWKSERQRKCAIRYFLKNINQKKYELVMEERK